MIFTPQKYKYFIPKPVTLFWRTHFNLYIQIFILSDCYAFQVFLDLKNYNIEQENLEQHFLCESESLFVSICFHFFSTYNCF